jgi:Tfp pilus assembly protein PilO
MNQPQNNLPRILIVVAVLALVALGAYFTMIQPKLNEYSSLDEQLNGSSGLKAQYAALDAVAKQKPLYLSLIRQVQSRLANVELTADPRSYIPSYLKQIEDLATRDGLVVTAVVPQPLPSPSSSPTPSGVATVNPGISGKVSGASNALNATNSQVAALGTATPLAAGTPAAMSGATPIPVASGGVVPKVAGKPRASSPRTNAIAYLNQSFQQIPINMELSGTYTDLQKFLRDLNKFPKLIGVGNVTLTTARGGIGEIPKLHIVLPIIAYRLSPNAPAAQATPPQRTPNGGQ